MAAAVSEKSLDSDSNSERLVSAVLEATLRDRTQETLETLEMEVDPSSSSSLGKWKHFMTIECRRRKGQNRKLHAETTKKKMREKERAVLRGCYMEKKEREERVNNRGRERRRRGEGRGC